MATGPEMLEILRQATAGQPAGAEYWIDIQQKIDLCKLRVSDLLQASFDEKLAEKTVIALNKQDVKPLGDALGISLRVQFKVWADRQEHDCTIRCEGAGNATWLRQHLAEEFANLQATNPVAEEERNEASFIVMFSAGCTPYLLRRVLTDCSATFPMRLFTVSVAEQPHYIVQAYNLADWLENQEDDDDIWWTVDGDPTLMSRMEFPAPPDELAHELRQINKVLFVRDPNENGSGEELTPEDIHNVSDSDEWGNRRFLLCWAGSRTDWELIEDEPTSESSSGY